MAATAGGIGLSGSLTAAAVGRVTDGATSPDASADTSVRMAQAGSLAKTYWFCPTFLPGLNLRSSVEVPSIAASASRIHSRAAVRPIG